MVETFADQPVDVYNFYTHPEEGAEQGVVKGCPPPHTHTLPSHIGQDPGKEEEQIEEGEGSS